jgi:ketohexokinase
LAPSSSTQSSRRYTYHRQVNLHVAHDLGLTNPSVPHFPLEDSKIRASNHTVRRGGNVANTLEVLAQCLPTSTTPGRSSKKDNEDEDEETTLHLLAVLPDKTSPATQFIRSSLPSTVGLEGSCIFRRGTNDAPSSYIIVSEEHMSRTCVSVRNLADMTREEFIDRVDALACVGENVWFHFEGRMPQVVRQCVRWLREEWGGKGEVRISVECEKPEREGMGDVAMWADVLFYSKLWAEVCLFVCFFFTCFGYGGLGLTDDSQTHGYEDPVSFLTAMLDTQTSSSDSYIPRCKTLCCTWGASGAYAVNTTPAPDLHTGQTTSSPNRPSKTDWAETPAWHPEDPASPPIDTIGAGDTFIAGMLYALTQHPGSTLQEKAEYANELAGRKVFREGFGGLGVDMKWKGV